MIGTLLRAAGLTAVYLLVLTSIDPWDVALAAVLGLSIAVALRPSPGRPRAAAPPISPRGVAAVLGQTLLEMVRGSWRVARFCLGAPASPGFVEIPRGDRTDVEVAAWGVLTGEAPDEVVVDVDEERELLVVHLVDARSPQAVRERHRRTHETARGRGTR